MNRRWWLLGGALLAAAMVPLLLGGTGLFERLRHFPGSLLVTMLAMVLVGWNLNALRLRLLLGRRKLGQRRAFGIVVATEFAICATPGGAGGPLTLMALLMRQGVAPAKGTATYAVEQLSDLLFFACALVGVLIYALTHALSTHIASLLGFSVALLIGVMALLALLGRFHRQVFLLNGWLVTRLGMKETRKRRWARKVLGFRNALVDCFRLPRRILLAVFGLTTLHWLLRFSVLYLTLQGWEANWPGPGPSSCNCSRSPPARSVSSPAGRQRRAGLGGAADAHGGQVDHGRGDSDLAVRDLLLLPDRRRTGIPAAGRAAAVAPADAVAACLSGSSPMAGRN